jgi:hypothetical protein
MQLLFTKGMDNKQAEQTRLPFTTEQVEQPEMEEQFIWH